VKQPATHQKTEPTERRPYVPPRIVEEEIFERDALMASCRLDGDCAPFKSPS